MINIVAFGGEPASGKSTVMKTAIGLLNERPIETAQLLPYLALLQNKVAVLGTYAPDQPFGGTDRFAMNIQPTAEAFLQLASQSVCWNGWSVWLEGDRLFNSKYLHRIYELAIPHWFFVLTANAANLAYRHARRDQQNETWLKGRRTKVANLVKEFSLEEVDNNNAADMMLAANRIVTMTRSMQEAQRVESPQEGE